MVPKPREESQQQPQQARGGYSRDKGARQINDTGLNSFNDTMDEWNAQFGTIKREIVTTVLPPLTDFLRMLTRLVGWMRDNQAFTVMFFSALAGVLVAIYAPAAWTAAAATWALVAPYVAVGVAVLAVAAAIALVSEDLYAFGQGHDSVTGRLAERWPIIGDAIRGVGQSITWLVAMATAWFGFLVDVVTKGPKKAFQSLRESLRGLIADIESRFPKIGIAMQIGLKNGEIAIKSLGAVWDWLMGKVDAGLAAFEKLSQFLGFSEAKAERKESVLLQSMRQMGITVDQSSIQRGSDVIAATRTPLAAQTSNSIVNQGARTRTTNVQIGPVAVQTQAADGQQVAAVLGSTLSQQLKSAIDDTDDAVLA
jgi:cytochrome c oxidase subunit IV